MSSIHYNLCHPTEKPIRLAERIIALISDPGDTIYDPFMGSGAFGEACLNTGRKYIGSEIDKGYCGNISGAKLTRDISVFPVSG
jgi:site-specific DNA-methyltransferase (adenine-specific)